MKLRQLFLFLEPETGGDPHRVSMDCDGVETILTWVPDVMSAVRIADQEAAAGLGIVELYRGFDLAAAAAVVAQVGDRAAVGLAVYPHGVTPPSRIIRSATIFRSGSDAPEPVMRQHPGGGRTVVVGAPHPAATVDLARGFVEDGIDLVEICGGEPLTTAARVHDAVAGRVPISYVVYPYDSLDGATAFKNHFAKAG